MLQENHSLNENVHTYLKRNTASYHEVIEKMNPFDSELISIPGYTQFLVKNYKVFDPLEKILENDYDWSSIGIDFQDYKRRDLLKKDIENLGIDPESLMQMKPIPVFASIAQALGALYVLEGSSLGGRIILNKIQSIYGDKLSNSLEFLKGNGERTGVLWKDFLLKMNNYAEKNTEQREAILYGTIQTYRCFENVFSKFENLQREIMII